MRRERTRRDSGEPRASRRHHTRYERTTSYRAPTKQPYNARSRMLSPAAAGMPTLPDPASLRKCRRPPAYSSLSAYKPGRSQWPPVPFPRLLGILGIEYSMAACLDDTVRICFSSKPLHAESHAGVSPGGPGGSCPCPRLYRPTPRSTKMQKCVSGAPQWQKGRWHGTHCRCKVNHRLASEVRLFVVVLDLNVDHMHGPVEVPSPREQVCQHVRMSPDAHRS